MSSARARSCSTRSARRAAKGSSRRGPTRPIAATRTRNWLKVKCIQRQEFVIVGWSESDKRRGFRSLLLGVTRRGQADLRRQGRHRLQRADDRRPDGADGARSRSTSAPLEVPRAERRARTGSSRSWSPKSPSPSSPTTASCATRASSRCARTSRRRRWCAKCRKHLEASAEAKKGRARDRRELRHQDPQPRPGDLSRSDGLTKGELADYYAAVEPLMHGRRGQPADQPGPLPAGPRQAMLLPEARQRHVRRARQAVPIKEKDGETEDYLYVDDVRGLLACVQMGTIEFHGWGSRVEQARESRPAGVRPRSRRRARFRQGEGSGGPSCAPCSPTWASISFPLLTGGKGIHVVVPLDRDGRLARGQRASPSASAAPSPRPSRSASPPTSARSSARAASSSTGCATSAARPRSCPIRPAPAKARRSPRRSPGRSWTITTAATPSPSAMPTNCSKRAESKRLAGWGKAKQSLPDA